MNVRRSGKFFQIAHVVVFTGPLFWPFVLDGDPESELTTAVTEIKEAAEAAAVQLVFPTDIAIRRERNIHFHQVADMLDPFDECDETMTTGFDLGPDSIETIEGHVESAQVIVLKGRCGLTDLWSTRYISSTKRIAKMVGMEARNKPVFVIGADFNDHVNLLLSD